MAEGGYAFIHQYLGGQGQNKIAHVPSSSAFLCLIVSYMDVFYQPFSEAKVLLFIQILFFCSVGKGIVFINAWKK